MFALYHGKAARVHPAPSLVPKGNFRDKLPTRVIDVKPPDSLCVQFYESGGASAQYITLSHCWVSSPTVRLTQRSLEHMMERIDINSLPRTFPNAVELACRLNIQYLWIDSLCIVQDSLEDWRLEASNMASIYQNSVITVAGEAMSYGIYLHSLTRADGEYVCLNKPTISFAIYRLS